MRHMSNQVEEKSRYLTSSKDKYCLLHEKIFELGGQLRGALATQQLAPLVE